MPFRPLPHLENEAVETLTNITIYEAEGCECAGHACGSLNRTGHAAAEQRPAHEWQRILHGQRVLAESLIRERTRRQYRQIPRRADGSLILTERSEGPMRLSVQLPSRNHVVA